MTGRRLSGFPLHLIRRTWLTSGGVSLSLLKVADHDGAWPHPAGLEIDQDC